MTLPLPLSAASPFLTDDDSVLPSSAHRPPPDRPKRVVNLAAMASSVLRARGDVPQHRHTVRYIAQVDKDGIMVKRTKVGGKVSMMVVLEGTMLTVMRQRAGVPRHVVNVRATPVTVDVGRRELHVYLPGNVQGKDRLLRLHIGGEAESREWKKALEAAVDSDITDYFLFGRTLGNGAYGEVVQAADVRTGETRAVKIIKRGTSMKSREHVEAEIQAMKLIAHENIVQTYQIFDLKTTIYIVMEYVEGGDLFDFVAQQESLTEAQASQVMRSIFGAVGYLHGNSIVHRDLKPENILCANRGWPLEVKVTDFGFASFLDPQSDSERTMHTQVGTAYFMAPEIIVSEGHGPAVDMWACGVILYTMLTGRLPFPGKNTKEYFINVMKGRPLFPAVLWKGISKEALRLVKALLNHDPQKRLHVLGAMRHEWIVAPDAGSNAIRRDRSNLHSRRRRLYKARSAIIAVAMANKFKATIPQVVDKVGDGTKKAAKKTGEGVKKVGDGIGEGTKKVAEGVGEGTKKVASGIATGSKKMADGIGTGVRKTADGVETSAKKVGAGVKKTADGIENGLKKTAGGIETGFKKTGEGIKKTGGGIKRGVEKVKKDRDRNRGGGGSEDEQGDSAHETQSDSTRDSNKKRPMFRRRAQNMKPPPIPALDTIKEIDLSAPQLATPQSATPFLRTEQTTPKPNLTIPQLEVLMSKLTTPTPLQDACALKHGSTVPLVGKDLTDAKSIYTETNSLTKKYSSSEYFSAHEEHGASVAGWETVEGEDMNAATVRISSRQSSTAISCVDNSRENGVSDAKREPSRRNKPNSKNVSNVSSASAGSTRPKLAPLNGLPIGLTDDRVGMTTARDQPGGPTEIRADNGEDRLRKAAALLLASNTSSFGLDAGL